MAAPNEKLATSLAALATLAPARAVAARSLTRTHRERLVRAGFLSEVVKGWYIQARPDDRAGDSTAWFASMREFIAGYCDERFGDQWHIGPEQSLMLRAGERSLPRQVLVWAPQANNQVLNLPHGTSLLLYRTPRLLPAAPVADAGGLRLVSLAEALVRAGPAFFTQQPLAATVALASVPDASELLHVLLAGSHTSLAGRLAGALRHAGRGEFADRIVSTMRAAGHKVDETNPFQQPVPLLPGNRAASPYACRLQLMWRQMRTTVEAVFPAPAPVPSDAAALLRDVEARYVTDAYHSLSIEGYSVTPELIEKVRTGTWDPDGDDRQLRDAMAAKGYFEAHKEVKASVERLLAGANPGAELRAAHATWYQALFSPSVQAGLLKPQDLAGYRNDQVFIRGAQHVPLSKEAVRDTMPVLFDLLEDEVHAGARAVLGHFVFVYIHPYMDGNGRLARFLMNAMLAPSGYPWTVIPVQRRAEYMAALAQASSHQDIAPFAQFVAQLVTEQRAAPLPWPPSRQASAAGA